MKIVYSEQGQISFTQSNENSRKIIIFDGQGEANSEN